MEDHFSKAQVELSATGAALENKLDIQIPNPIIICRRAVGAPACDVQFSAHGPDST